MNPAYLARRRRVLNRVIIETLEPRMLLSTNPLDDGTVLWQIGKEDYSNAEFGSTQVSSYTIPSDWSTRTNWTGFGQTMKRSTGANIDISFTLASVPANGVDFNFRSVATSRSTPELDVYSNGELAGQIQTWGVGSFDVWTGDFQQVYHLYIPKEMLLTGTNDLRLNLPEGLYSTSAGDGLTYVGFDYLRLNQLAAAAPEPVNGRVIYMGTNLTMAGDTPENGSDPNYGAFNQTTDLVRAAPDLLEWLGIAYSGNTMRDTDWDDTASLQPARLQLLQTYANMNMTVLGDCLGSDATMTGGNLSTTSQNTLNSYFSSYGNLIQYYEVSNEPDNFGPSEATVQAIAEYVAANKPATVQEVAPGWAYDGWEATNANRLAIDAYCNDINGHAYGTSYMNNSGGSFMENLSAYGGSSNLTDTGTLNNGFPEPFIDTEMGANNWHTDLSQFDDTQPNAGAFDRDLRSYIAVADNFMQHASMFNDGGVNDYGMFNAPSDWSTVDPGTISVDPCVSGQDTRLQIYRRLALTYATHGAPLSYTLQNAAQLQYKDVYVRAVNTATLAPAAGSGATSNKILLSFVNDEQTAQTIQVQVTMPASGVYQGQVIGDGNTFNQACSQVSLTANPYVTISLTVPPRDSVEYILNPAASSTTAPTAASQTAATAISSTQAVIRWQDNSSNETGFKIERATNSTFTQNDLIVTTTAANATSYTDTGLTAGTTYYYRVRATNAGGDAANSATVSVLMPTIPAGPTSLKATGVSTSQIDLTWTDNANNETFYNVERATNSAFTQNDSVIAIAAANTKAYNNTTISPGTTYYYRVFASNAAGDSTDSNPADAPVMPAFSNLSASSTITYGTASATFSGTIAAGSLIPPGNETVAIVLNGVTQNAAIGSLGNFSSTFTTSTLFASATPYQVTYYYAGDANFLTVTDNTTTTLTVNKATPTITWATPGTITYGTALNGTQLDASASVAGGFAYSPAAGTVLHAGTQTLSVTFTPTDTTDYNTVTANVSLTVNKAATTTSVTSSNSSALSGLSVTFTATITPAASSGETGTVQFEIDGGNVGSPVTLTGNAATYATSTLSAGNHTIVAVYGGDGNFTGSTSPGFTQNITTAWYLPSGAATWNAATLTLTLTGNVTIIADPNRFGFEPLIYANASNLTVDTKILDGGDGDATVHLAAISGNGTTTINGTGLLVAGNFSQASLINNGTVTLDGASAIGQLTGNGSLTIGNGSSNNTVQLTAAVLPDSFANTEQALTISTGSTLDITNNTLVLNYGNSSSPLAAVRAAVAGGTIISSTANAGNVPNAYTVGYADATEVGGIPAGDVKLMYTLVGDANLDGAANFDDYSVLQNNYNQTGRDWSQGDFNHDGLVNFNDYSLLQNNYNQAMKATPLISWPTPAAITFGTALSAAQLDATASVPGTFVYSPALGAVPYAGTQTLSLTFTPTDTTDYNTVTASVNLLVNKAATSLAITSNNATPIYAQAITFTATITPASGTGATGTVQFQIDGGNVGTPVTVSGNDASFTIATLALGNHSIAAIYRGDGNFTGSTAPAFILNIGRATLTYTLSINDDGSGHYCAGHYAVYAADSLNNAGLASYDIHLGNATTITNYSPQGNYDDGTGNHTSDEVGFTALRTANNASPATASQDTVADAAGGKVFLVYGLAQTAGNLATDKAPGSTGAAGATTQAVYGAPLELLKGTFSTAAPTFTSQSLDTGNIFLTNSGYGTEAAILAFSTTTLVTGDVIPAAASAPAAVATTPIASRLQDLFATLDNPPTDEGMIGYLL